MPRFPIFALVLFFCQASPSQPPGKLLPYTTAALHTLLPIATGYYLHHRSHETVQSFGTLLGAYGFIAGPSMGNYLLNDNARGMAGVVFRTAGAAFSGVGLFHNLYPSPNRQDDPGHGALLFVGLTSAIWNVLSLEQSRKEFQESGLFRFSIAPYGLRGSEISLRLGF